LHWLLALVTASVFFTLTFPVKMEHSSSVNPEVRVKNSATDSLEVDNLSPILRPVLAERTTAPEPVSPVVIFHGDRDRKVVALTFDACSATGPSRYDKRITNILIETKTPATLFLGGKWMKEQSEPTKYLALFPQFEFANHAFHHPHLIQVSDDNIRQELRRTQEVMDSLTGRQPTLFRAPYGEYDDRVARIAAEMGLRTIQYDLASGDPDPSFTKEKLIRYVTATAMNGSIIVMHMNQRGWHTAEALPEIIARLRLRGFTFETVTDMITQTNQR
jgi:peptidoglycan/xylan/chitin deacetylase (PgdA/CDA1 family)